MKEPDRGLFSEVLMIIQFPAARDGPALAVNIITGTFQAKTVQRFSDSVRWIYFMPVLTTDTCYDAIGNFEGEVEKAGGVG